MAEEAASWAMNSTCTSCHDAVLNTGSLHCSTYYFEGLFDGCKKEDVEDDCVGADIEEAVHRATIPVRFHSSLPSLLFHLLSCGDLE